VSLGTIDDTSELVNPLSQQSLAHAGVHCANHGRAGVTRVTLAVTVCVTDVARSGVQCF
jgi:hypothetical protein